MATFICENSIFTEMLENAIKSIVSKKVNAHLAREGHALKVTLDTLSKEIYEIFLFTLKINKRKIKKKILPTYSFEKLFLHTTDSDKTQDRVRFGEDICDVEIIMNKSSSVVDVDITFSKGKKTVTLSFEFVLRLARKPEIVSDEKNPYPPTGNPS
jgi:hypothetical protein